MTQEDYRKLPRAVQQLCELFDCMIIGSTVKGSISDIDLVTPIGEWPSCASFLVASSKNIIPTRFGGWRFRDVESHRVIDIWPSTIEQVINSTRPSNIYWPKHHLMLSVEIQ